ncbi:Lrp/AsnC family transcriptional regulator [Halotalea alkalilenta]|uniref:AsnC family transcriptional regulator n=1 Tax=Halotalea alkalilenta TaxID=376489 RepID=A0A172YJQ3_9GAMM|nr:Lrp/AsnC family transcriptional regulator [Halotalea alkalilenta]ANF59453.1 AsnC family transcriptional regulator [Halotalea alkalilenta]
MDQLDNALLNILIKDSRVSYADMARQLNISRAYARVRVKALVDSGVIESFTTVINPEKLGKSISNFVDLTVAPHAIEQVAERLASTLEVVSLYIMSDLKSLHVHTLTDGPERFEAFVREHIFNHPEILSVNCTALMTRVKHRRGGARL